MEEATTTAVIYFKHVYKVSGFAISGKFTDDGKDYNPPSRHACLESGIYCKEHLNQVGRVKGTLRYLSAQLTFSIHKIRRIIKI